MLCLFMMATLCETSRSLQPEIHKLKITVVLRIQSKKVAFYIAVTKLVIVPSHIPATNF
jgi:hypothetical protein